MNIFQKSCIDGLSKIFEKYSIQINVEEKEGSVGAYLFASSNIFLRKLSVVIYEDEAGVSIERDPNEHLPWWMVFSMHKRERVFMFEKPDYEDSRELVAAFLKKVEILIEEINKNNRGG